MSSAAAGWRSAFSNVPPLTKSLSTSMTVLAALGFAFRFRDLLLADHSDQGQESSPDPAYPSAEAALIPLIAMIPVSAPYRFWTFVTASLFEKSIIQFAISNAILLGCGKYLERAWGSREFFKFFAVTGIGSMLAVYFTCLFEYFVRGNEDVMYDTQVYGLTAVIGGFLVGFKQLVPEHLITLWGIISVRVKTLPLIFVLFMIFTSLIARSQVQLMLAIYGLFISWIYSRFFKVQDGFRGDRSETFSFASFFPEAAQPPVKAVSNLVFGILVRLRICSPLGFGTMLEQDLDNPQNSGMVLPLTQPASLRAEAERRRALALKALDMRLHAAATNGANLPGLSQKTFLGPTPSGGSPSSYPSSFTDSSSTYVQTQTHKPNTGDDVLFETTILDEEPVTSASSKPRDDSSTGLSSAN